RAVIAWEGAEARLRAAHERVAQRAKEGQSLPRSFGVPRARAPRPQHLERNDTRASAPRPSRTPGSVGAPLRTPAASARGAVSQTGYSSE
ncbi:MAG TPA: hypothetical protein VHZ51_06595, partial [Ktedonobacteraceae bacterium]|nr:hypothetical protein [Ktedonobacteraceae bacterium]